VELRHVRYFVGVAETLSRVPGAPAFLSHTKQAGALSPRRCSAAAPGQVGAGSSRLWFMRRAGFDDASVSIPEAVNSK
jgi:hypothetical protein